MAGLFIYQLECIRAEPLLGYADGLKAMSEDPLYGDDWRRWILRLQSELGTLELAELVFRVSEHFYTGRARQAAGWRTVSVVWCCLVSRRAGLLAATSAVMPLYLFAALQRGLGYPSVPKIGGQ
ncbi:MAG UNVERIFIED_CONTAM: hypothetical protein LVR18_34855 [Planctomycetaceae bacterium]|jgi:hypothetical protein